MIMLILFSFLLMCRPLVHGKQFVKMDERRHNASWVALPHLPQHLQQQAEHQPVPSAVETTTAETEPMLREEPHDSGPLTGHEKCDRLGFLGHTPIAKGHIRTANSAI
ncbi:unnamed protein product [Vitrella brassicaformis CCMP3155]|uniref:Secreted protein n=1 Tax=Vitrella brassicaformis (strain CCMP3155) TaxID=1169540 RepID=A0A0G4FE03_VITBC|nr:unnamed protein product [Vitrella brassicaformis CCMP3155]|eukprot:CEM11433.1 unnamed protein product [Vitrella brassicaformis CCMP3155]